jgi:hypothetical protein
LKKPFVFFKPNKSGFVVVGGKKFVLLRNEVKMWDKKLRFHSSFAPERGVGGDGKYDDNASISTKSTEIIPTKGHPIRKGLKPRLS